jgi:hypothetical protein
MGDWKEFPACCANLGELLPIRHWYALAYLNRGWVPRVNLRCLLKKDDLTAVTKVTDRPRELRIRSHQGEAHQVLVTVKDCGVGIFPAAFVLLLSNNIQK